MKPEIQSIIDKLTPEELKFVNEKFGIDFRNSQLIEISENLEDERSRIRSLRKHHGEKPQCSFCNGTILQVGRLSESFHGLCICGECCQRALELINEDSKNDA